MQGSTMRFAFLDSMYPEAYAALGGRNATYETLFDSCFGTADAWDVALRSRGHISNTVYGEHEDDIMAFCMDADSICVQNVGRWPAAWMRLRFANRKKLFGFCSYATEIENVLGFDMTFSSFPWLVEEIKHRGGKASYLPLAFQREVNYRVESPVERDLPLTAVCGLGSRIWASGTRTMARVAEEFSEFAWFGYGAGDVPQSLQKAYHGPVWGHDYYRTLMRSRITINRHGEVAKGCANNLRLFEATGCGAMLLTEDAPNLDDFFCVPQECLTYGSDDRLVAQIRQLLASPSYVDDIRATGQARTLRDHCYENRVDAFLEAVECL